MIAPDLIFNTRLARRLFLYFLGIAFVPILAFGYLTYWQTHQQITRTHDYYLLKTAEMFNQLFFNRLLQLEDALRMQAVELSRRHTPLVPEFSSHSTAEGRQFFLHYETRAFSREGFSDPELRHLHSGRALLARHGSGKLSMGVPIPRNRAVLVGVIRPELLWGIPEELPLPHDTSLLVLDVEGTPLFQSKNPATPLPAAVLREILSQSQSKITARERQNREDCYSRELFLESQYLFPRWTLVLRQEHAATLDSQTRFTTLFPLMVALCLGLVLYMILILIRRTLAPLSELRALTDSVARQDFDARVTIRTGDEIEELGHAFNTMAAQLKRQFSALSVQARIDREILSSLDAETVAHSALDFFSSSLGARRTLLGLWDNGTFRAFCQDADGCRTVTAHVPHADTLVGLRLRLQDAGWLHAAQVPELRDVCAHLRGLDGVVCSLPRHGTPQGLVYMDGLVFPPDSAELDLAGRTLNQVAVAFANIRLVGELREFNWGTLEALARAVDEKSPWTSGHSHRVAALAIDLAVQMGWEERGLDQLHRAALLHDLGKIGIATEILDKPGPLTDEEFAIIRTHPDRGGKILEPVRAYAAIIPMIRHHHERMDGSGYPSGLRGDAIPLGARILAVADVYDALTMDRPYRAGWSRKKTENYLRENAGTLFDADVVRALLAMR